uniref:Angiotensin-converting enzyme n=1 Tax=Lutzomyia longipalpis TaxID=7200 RepID=A0A1B0CRV6_LUTLO
MFDAGAKFHVADNTPYVRYFLASIIQMQIFKGLCQMTIFDRVAPEEPLPMPLHRCDIYGSKRAGKILRKSLSLGASVHWTEVLKILTGSEKISAEPLLEYYKPLIDWLQHTIHKFDIPGIRAPGHGDRHRMFDAGAKFHVADNTPYVRYFLASIIQMQIFKGLCQMTIFDRVAPEEPLPMPLHRCDIYGSKRAGKILR